MKNKWPLISFLLFSLIEGQLSDDLLLTSVLQWCFRKYVRAFYYEVELEARNDFHIFKQPHFSMWSPFF